MDKEQKIEEQVKFKGKYISTVGRRKRAVARIRLYKDGKGNILVNDLKHTKYFTQDKALIIQQPLKQVNHLRDLDLSVIVKGGGVKSQAEAVRHGITRALLVFDIEFKDQFKEKGWITRDARKTERKKPGLKKARKAPQWSKR